MALSRTSSSATMGSKLSFRRRLSTTGAPGSPTLIPTRVLHGPVSPTVIPTSPDDHSLRRCFKCQVELPASEFPEDYWWMCNDCVENMSVASMNSAAEPTWPPEKRMYIDHCPESSQLNGYSRLREFTMGAGCFHTADHLDLRKVANQCPQVDPEKCAMDFTVLLGDRSGPVGPDTKRLTFHTKVLLVTELVNEMRVCRSRTGAVCGITFVKDDQVLQAGCVIPDLDQALPLDPDFPFLKKITMQQSIWEDPIRQVLEKGITYLRLETPKGDVLESGQLRDVSAKLGEMFLEPIEEEGVLAIVGIGFAHALPISLQIVDFSAMEDPAEHTETVFYQREVLSFVCITQNMPLYEHLGMIAIEKDDFLPVVDELLDGVENANPSSSELLPNVIGTIDEALGSDTATMHSVFRIDRYLMNIAKTKSDVGMWDDHWNHWKKLVPLKQMFSILADMILLTKRISLNKPELNVYSYAFLSGQRSDYIKAYLTFATQLLLITMLFMGIDLTQFGEFQQSLIFSITVTAIVISMVKGQVDNHIAFKETFKDATLKNHIILMDFFANVVVAVFVVLSNFLLLASTGEYLDLVLNSTAIVFIIELDDAALNADAEAITDLYRGVCYQMVRDQIALKDERYWNAQQLRGEQPKINLEHAALVWKPAKTQRRHLEAKKEQ